MASHIIYVYENGVPVGYTSSTSTFDFLSVKVGAHGLEIKETNSKFDFSGIELTNIADATADTSAVSRGQMNTALSGKAAVNHNHDTVYLGIHATADDSAKLNGQSASYYATASHNHDTTYLGLHATADDSAKLNGQSASYYATASSLGNYLLLSGGSMSGNIVMGANKITSSYVPLDGNDLVNKTALDNAISGLSWKEPIDAFNLLGNDTAANLNGKSPAEGDQWVVTSAGTLTLGSLSVAIGDLVEFKDGAWIMIDENAGGFVDSDTRAILGGNGGTIYAPYTNGVDNGKVVHFTGASNTGVATTDATNKNSLIVEDDASVSLWDNSSYVYQGTVPSGQWVQFNGANQISAGVGLRKMGNTLSVKLGAGIIELPTSEVGIDLYTSNPGLILTLDGSTSSTDTAARLAVKVDGTTIERGASGLNVKSGVYAAASHNQAAASITDFASAAKSAVVLNTLAGDQTDQSPSVHITNTALSGKSNTDHLHTGVYSPVGHGHAAADISDFASVVKSTAVADTITNGVTDVAPSQNAVFDALALKADAGNLNPSQTVTNDNGSAITIRQLVYVKPNGHVDLADNGSDLSLSRLGLVADASIASSGTGKVNFANGYVTDFSGLTVGKYYMGLSGAITHTLPSGSGKCIMEVGDAISSSVLYFAPRHIINL